MGWKTWVPLIAAIVLGVAAAKVAHDLVAHARAHASTGPQGVQIMIAARGVAVGDILGKGDLRVARLDLGRGAAPEGLFASADALVGRVAKTPIAAGQPVLDTMLAPVGAGAGFQALIPPGMRAVTVEITESSGVGGLLMPGCRVDVIATFEPRGQEESRSRVIVQGAHVAAVGRMFAAQGPDAAAAASDSHKSVTLLVDPRAAEAVALAATTGRVRLVLRSPADEAYPQSTGMTMAELRGDRPRQPALTLPPDVMARLAQLEEYARTHATTMPVAQPPLTPPVNSGAVVARPQPVRRMVEVIRGGAESVVTFEMADGSSTAGAPAAGQSVGQDPFTRMPVEP